MTISLASAAHRFFERSRTLMRRTSARESLKTVRVFIDFGDYLGGWRAGWNETANTYVIEGTL
jgi:hypothetical protein